MDDITYISDGKALEYTLPDGCNADYIALIPRDANGKISLINGTDYLISHGVIRFFRVPPEGASIIVSNDINNIITADTEFDLSNEVREREALAAVLERNTDSLAELSEAAINNSLTLSDLYERIRNMEQKS